MRLDKIDNRLTLDETNSTHWVSEFKTDPPQGGDIRSPFSSPLHIRICLPPLLLLLGLNMVFSLVRL